MTQGTDTTDTTDTTDKRTRTGRRAIWLAIVVAIIWLAIGSFAGPLAGKLSEVQKNDNASFLPASAESTLVAKEVAGFSEAQSLPILVVMTKPDGGSLTKGDLAAATTFAADIPGLAVGTSTLRTYLDPQPIVPIPSQDGKAVLLNIPLNGDKATQKVGSDLVIKASTESIRAAAAKVTALQINVTGPGGIFTDLLAVFGSIDTTLLGATALIVAVILIFVYRSPFLWLVPLLSAGMALSAASAIVYVLAKNDVLVLNGQSQGILTVLVFGAGTDYALLLVARYREELHHFDSHTDAMRSALRGVLEPIVASAATVIIGLLCLLLSELNSNRSTGPVGAAGIAGALVVMLTFLPALLVIPSVVLPILAFIVPTVLGLGLHLIWNSVPIGPFAALGGMLALITIIGWIVFGILRLVRPTWGPFSRTRFPAGRWAFWPKVPQEGDTDERLSGVWSRIAGGIGHRPRITWIVTALVMLILACFTFTLKASGITTTQGFINRTDSVVGQELLAQHYPGGLGTPVIILANGDHQAVVLTMTKETTGIADAAFFTGSPPSSSPGQSSAPKVVNNRIQILATLVAAADSPEANDTVKLLRDRLHAIAGAEAIVGGQTASQLDVNEASVHDRNLIIPVVLAVIFLVLIVLLRALAAPVILIGTVVLSYFATLGVCALLFNHVFQFAGADTSFPLFAFVFLVALGVDYNIFLMTRVREESRKLGTRAGILKGLTVTGGVITSAGIVLAATFLVLGVLPLVALREVGLAVAIGVLLDTFIIRSTLVPALAYDIGRKIWWPSALAKAPQPEPESVPTKVG